MDKQTININLNQSIKIFNDSDCAGYGFRTQN